MPVNLHVADPIWVYEPMDRTNDGLMNAFKWRLDDKPGIVGHSEMIDILERTVKRHLRTIFVACHFANQEYDLARHGALLNYADRPVYGIDMGYSLPMYRVTFRVLETLDEHFLRVPAVRLTLESERARLA